MAADKPPVSYASRAWHESFEARLWQSYLAGLKRYWGGPLYRSVVLAAQSVPSPDTPSLEEAMQTNAAYRLYAYLERRIQQMKWAGRWGFASEVNRQHALLAPLLARASTCTNLRLRPDLAMPLYVTSTDTHQQPGGLWSDPVNAYALAWYTTGLSFALSNPDELVDFYAAKIKERCDRQGLMPDTILDEGCTAGRSTRAIERVFPSAAVIGCDVCEGSLRLGALRAVEEKSAIQLVQCSVEDLDWPDHSLDVVASHWLWHELPPAAIVQSIREAARTLRPGGLFVAYDMIAASGGAIGKWLLSGYAARNNEPFAHALLDFDWRDALARAGFRDIESAYGLPQEPGPDTPDQLTPFRLHPMLFISAVRA